MALLRYRDDEAEGFECPTPITCQFPRCDCKSERGAKAMTTNERIAAALELAKNGKLAEARSILLLANADNRAWAKFGKYWRGE